MKKGKPIGVYVKSATQSNQLIEEFMLLANRTVATHIGQSGAPRPLSTGYMTCRMPRNWKT